MVILISGTTHTGKTALAQKLLQKYNFPYLSIDHLKMGLIRSGQTSLTVEDDEALTDYLWNIVKEMVKTAIENGQNLIAEGCYIPFDWQMDFEKQYLENIRFCCIVMSKDYIRKNFEDIGRYANVIEKRLCDGIDIENMIADNEYNLSECKKYGLDFILIENDYERNLSEGLLKCGL